MPVFGFWKAFPLFFEPPRATTFRRALSRRGKESFVRKTAVSSLAIGLPYPNFPMPPSSPKVKKKASVISPRIMTKRRWATFAGSRLSIAFDGSSSYCEETALPDMLTQLDPSGVPIESEPPSLTWNIERKADSGSAAR